MEKLRPEIMRLCTKRVIFTATCDDSKIPPAEHNIRNRESKGKNSLSEGSNDPSINTRISRITINIKQWKAMDEIRWQRREIQF